MTQIGTETYELGKSLVEIGNAKLRLEYIVKTGQAGNGAKQMIKGWINRLNFIENDLRHRLSPEQLHVMTSQLMNDEDRQQTDAVMGMFINLPKHVRDMIEQKVEDITELVNKEKQ